MPCHSCSPCWVAGGSPPRPSGVSPALPGGIPPPSGDVSNRSVLKPRSICYLLENGPSSNDTLNRVARGDVRVDALVERRAGGAGLENLDLVVRPVVDGHEVV